MQTAKAPETILAPMQAPEAGTADGSEEGEAYESHEPDEEGPAAGVPTGAGHSAAPVRDLGPVGWEDPDSAAVPMAAAAPDQGKSVGAAFEVGSKHTAVWVATAPALCKITPVQGFGHLADRAPHGQPWAAAVPAQDGGI